MGSLCQELPSDVVEDLKVTIEDISLVFPSRETERKSMFLSNIDRVLNFNVETVHFFSAQKDFPPHLAVQKIRTSLAELLVPYDFLAGRLRPNAETGSLEIDCNAAGAAFLVASSDYALDDIGHLAYPNPAFSQLIRKTIYSLRQDDQPLCIMQVTKFKCGGFAMGISTNHTTFDGLSFKLFLENLAAVAADAPLSAPPCNNRRLLASRSPPRVTFPHPELLKLQDSSPPVLDAIQEALDFKIFRLTSADIAALKDKAKASTTKSDTRISGFNVVSALIWRCKALSFSPTDNNNNNKKGLNRVSTLLFAVDIRQRLVPPLPISYTGNAVLTAYARATCRELEEWPLGRVVEMVAEGARRMTAEYARSAIDWGEIYQGFPHGEFLISSWWKLGFEEVEYPWGQPRYSCPVVYHRKDIILLFPDIDKGKNKDGVNVLVALPREEMGRFQTLFHKFLLPENF